MPFQSFDDAAELLDRIPDPETVRRWRAEAIRRAELFRSLLRLAERKAAAEARPQSTTSDTKQQEVGRV